MDEVSGKLTVWSTSQAPHAHRTLYSLFLGLPEHKIRIISPDIGGGFGNKAPVYPGYICAIVGSMVTGRPVKWMEDRSENLMSTAFARDYHMHGEIAATRDGTILALRVKVLADHGAFNARRSRPSSPPGSSACSPAPTTCGRRTARSPGCTPTRRRAASRTRARSGSPRRCTWSSGWWTCWPASSAWTRPSCG